MKKLMLIFLIMHLISFPIVVSYGVNTSNITITKSVCNNENSICHIFLDLNTFSKKGKVYILRTEYVPHIPRVSLRGLESIVNDLVRGKLVYSEVSMADNMYSMLYLARRNSRVEIYNTTMDTIPVLIGAVQDIIGNSTKSINYVDLYSSGIIVLCVTGLEPIAGARKLISYLNSRLEEVQATLQVVFSDKLSIPRIRKVIIVYRPQDYSLSVTDVRNIAITLGNEETVRKYKIIGIGYSDEFMLPIVEVLDNPNIDELVERLNSVAKGKVVLIVGKKQLGAESLELEKIHWGVPVLVGVLVAVLLVLLYRYSRSRVGR